MRVILTGASMGIGEAAARVASHPGPPVKALRDLGRLHAHARGLRNDHSESWPPD